MCSNIPKSISEVLKCLLKNQHMLIQPMQTANMYASTHPTCKSISSDQDELIAINSNMISTLYQTVHEHNVRPEVKMRICTEMDQMQEQIRFPLNVCEMWNMLQIQETFKHPGNRHLGRRRDAELERMGDNLVERLLLIKKWFFKIINIEIFAK